MTNYAGTKVGGHTLEFGQHASNFYTEAAAYNNFRVRELNSFPIVRKTRVDVPSEGYARHAERGTNFLIEKGQEGTPDFTIDMRTGNAAGVQPLPFYILESGGWLVNANTAGVVEGYVDDGNWGVDSDIFGSDQEGQMVLVALDSGTYWPVLFWDWAGGGTDLGDITMKPPSALQNGNAVKIMYTATPTELRQVTETKLLCLRQSTHGTHTGTNDLGSTCLASAMASMGDLVFDFADPEGTLTFPFTFNSVKVQDIGSDSIAAETFVDGETVNPYQGCEVGLAAYTGATINSTPVNVEKITISNPYGSKFIPAEGNTASVINSIEGHMMTCAARDDGRVKVTITKKWAKSDLDNFEAGTDQYFHILKGTTAGSTPAWMVSVPRMEPSNLTVMKETDDWIRADVEFLGKSPKYAAAYGNLEPGDQQIFIGGSEYF